MHVKVKVFPNAAKELIRTKREDQFEMHIREPAHAGSANKRVQKILENIYPNTRIRLVSGHLSRSKIFEITH